MKRIHNRLAILLIFALLLSLAAPVGAAGSRITIRTPEDLVELSRRCSLDSWSRGKTVVLSADLDLSDVEFSSIPTFGGTFDGQGYTISGLTITGSGNVRGLFRYLQSGGVVQNVSLEVTIEPTDLQDSLGGLVGNNRGSVRNCTVTGSIQGETNIGGIIGVNESSGKIINSTFSGSVTGEHYVGGIAGQNLGSILQCVNQGKINTVAVEGEADLEDLDSRPLNSTENLPACTDIGGITGFSTGVLQSCKNTGPVGYEHVGYNVGGIAGRQSGYLNGCTNQGVILGRKDVGGIAGQLEPEIFLRYGEDLLNQLWSELGTLGDQVDHLLSDLNSTNTSTTAQLQMLSSHAGTAQDAAGELMDAAKDWANGNLSTVNDLSARISWSLQQLEPILENTYGCIVYQEQVMQIVRDLAGYSLGRSDLVRRAMSKKKASVMAEEREKFIYGDGDEVPGCVKNGIPIEAAEKIFDEMTDFAKYAFNKSHAACYAVVGYQTAWLKAHYPVEFMAALMTSVMDNAAKVSGYIEECKKMGIQLLPPDINEGYRQFSVSDGKIRFALAAIKNIGKGAVDALVAEREKNGKFTSLTDFCNRMEGGEWSVRGIEGLIKGGALDSFGGFRSQYMAIYKEILAGIGHARKNNIEGQLNLFDMGGDESFQQTDELPSIREFPPKEKLAMEKEALGIYVSGHPLAEYEEQLRRKISNTSMDFLPDEEGSHHTQIEDSTKVIVGGMVAGVSVKYTRNNDKMAFITLEDFQGSMEIVVFPKVYEKCAPLLQEDAVLLIRGRASVSADGEGKVIAADIKNLEQNEAAEIPSSVWLKLAAGQSVPFGQITAILRKYHGDVPVYIYDEKTRQKMKADRINWVTGEDALCEELRQLLGEKNVALKY